MRWRFLHAADLHLDSPLRGLDRHEGAPVEPLRSATRRALIALVDLAIEREVQALLIAGDLYDGDWDDFRTGLFFHQQMNRLASRDIRVFIVRGNHDAESRITRQLPPMAASSPPARSHRRRNSPASRVPASGRSLA